MNRRLRLNNGMTVDWAEASDLNKEFAKRFEVEPYDLATFNRGDGFPVQTLDLMKRQIHPGEFLRDDPPVIKEDRDLSDESGVLPNLIPDERDEAIAEAFNDIEEKIDDIKDLMDENDSEEKAE